MSNPYVYVCVCVYSPLLPFVSSGSRTGCYMHSIEHVHSEQTWPKWAAKKMKTILDSKLNRIMRNKNRAHSKWIFFIALFLYLFFPRMHMCMLYTNATRFQSVWFQLSTQHNSASFFLSYVEFYDQHLLFIRVSYDRSYKHLFVMSLHLCVFMSCKRVHSVYEIMEYKNEMKTRLSRSYNISDREDK